MTRHLAAAGRAIDWLSEHVGAYAWSDRLAFAEIPGFQGGMEHTTAIWIGSPVLDGGTTGDYVAIHEAAHHWWGDDVKIDGFPHFWMSEGFAEWTTAFTLFGEVVEVVDARAGRDIELRYRREAADLSYPRVAGEPIPGPLRFPDGTDIMTQVSRNLLFFYRYGAAFLEMIHRRLVRSYDTDLVTELGAWFEAHSGTRVTTEAFRDFLGERTGDAASFDALFDQWAFRGPAPTIEVGDFVYEGGIASRPDRIAVDPDGFYILRLAAEAGWTGPSIALAIP
jgi:aminopeptidase N